MPDYFGGFGGEDYTYRLPQQSVFGIRPGEGGVAGGLMQMLGPMVGEMFRKEYGGYGFTFGSGMNVESSVYLRRAYEQQMAARAAGAAADARSTQDLFRGIQAMINPRGVRGFDADGRAYFDPEVERSIGTVSGDASKIANVLAMMFPDEVDRATPGGSVSVGAARMANAGRYVRGADGRTLAEDANFGANVLGGLVSGDRRRTAGLRAGQVGALFEELTRLGMTGEGDADLGGSQVERVQARLEKYSKSIAAIRDIFAENGNPNAPMAQLVAGLQAMTQGGLGRMDADQLTRIVRTYQGAQQAFGVDIRALERMGGASAALLQAAGVNPVLGAGMPLNAVAARAAFQRAGHFDAVGGFEGINQNDLTQLVLAKQAAFAGSQFANQAGAIIGLAGSTELNSDLGRAAAALAKGETSVTLADGSTVDLASADQATLTRMAERSGISAGSFLGRLQNTNQNQAALARNPDVMNRLALAVQGQEYNTHLGNLLGRRFGGNQAAAVMSLLNMAPGDTDDKKALFVAQQLGLSRDDAAFIANTTGTLGQVYGAAAGVRTTGVAAGLLTNGQTLEGMADARKFMGQLGDINAATAHLVGNPLENLVRFGTQQGFAGNQGRGLMDLVMAMFGMVKTDEVQAARAGTTPKVNMGGTLRIIGPDDQVRHAVLNGEAAAAALGGPAIFGNPNFTPGGP